MRSFAAAFLVLGSICFTYCNARPEECELGPQPPRPQFCFNTDPTYTYDYVSNQCQVILQYGCPGYDNVFATEAECMTTCVEGDVKSAIQVADILNRNVIEQEPKIVNEIMDVVFSWVSSLLKSLGKDPVAIPDLKTDTIPNLEIGFVKGSLAGFSNLIREGDWGFAMDGLTKYNVKGGVGISDVTMNYTLVAKLFGYGGEADVSSGVANFGITFDFELDVLGCSIGLNDFTLGDIAHIHINIDAISFLDPVVEAVTEFLSNALMDVFTATVEKTILETVGVINVCKLVMDLIG